jgi:hypothetical protein
MYIYANTVVLIYVNINVAYLRNKFEIGKQINLCLQSRREQLNSQLKTKIGEEPKLCILTGDDDTPNALFIVGDVETVCRLPTADVAQAVLILLATYFLMNLNYPAHYDQTLGVLQHVCLNITFPPELRKAGFTLLKELM